jgi:hypothetical protein
MNIAELRALSVETAKKLMAQDIGAGQAFSDLFFAIDVLHNQEAAKGDVGVPSQGKLKEDTPIPAPPRKSLKIKDKGLKELLSLGKQLEKKGVR